MLNYKIYRIPLINITYLCKFQVETIFIIMKIKVERIYNCPKYCISHVYVNDKYVCDAIEDTDRMLDDSMDEKEIIKRKVYGETAIPTGTYRVLMNIVSPKYSKSAYFKKICGGKLPRLVNIKGFDGVLIHTGNDQYDTMGCLLVGYNKVKGKVVNSRDAFEKLYPLLSKANKAGEDITITYLRKY